MKENIEIAKMLWTQDQADLQGKYFTLSGAICNPKPLQYPHPPILIGGGGEQLTLRLVAQYADKWNIGPGTSMQNYVRKTELLKTYCHAIGRRFEDIKLSRMVFMFVANNSEELNRQVCDSIQELHAPPELYRENKIIGTPDECIKAIEELVDSGVVFPIINFPRAHDQKTIRLFCRQVMPSFR